jgi:[NiFe] hydrogenase assembly HybE family chaperone
MQPDALCVKVVSDPTSRLTDAFRAAAQRMAGLAFVNPALDVEAIAFAPWEGRWLGVMLTPWFMNLVLTPLDAEAWRPLIPGAKQRYRFPAGDYEFVGARDDAIGEYQVCSLFSPLLEFDDHETARLVANLAREALFDPANAEAEEVPVESLSGASEKRPGPLEQFEESLDAPLSRRDLLHGRIWRRDREHRG